MLIPCRKTSTILEEELPEWIKYNDILELANQHEPGWSRTILAENYVCLAFRPEWGLIGFSTIPQNSPTIPLTLDMLKQYAFLRMTGDCNENDAIRILTAGQG